MTRSSDRSISRRALHNHLSTPTIWQPNLTIELQRIRPHITRNPAQLHIIEAVQHRAHQAGHLQRRVYARRNRLIVQHDAAVAIANGPAVVQAHVQTVAASDEGPDQQ